MWEHSAKQQLNPDFPASVKWTVYLHDNMGLFVFSAVTFVFLNCPIYERRWFPVLHCKKLLLYPDELMIKAFLCNLSALKMLTFQHRDVKMLSSQSLKDGSVM